MTTRAPTTHHFATPLSAASLSAASLSAAVGHALGRLRSLRQRRALAAELSDLSDRALADIGMARATLRATPFDLPNALYR